MGEALNEIENSPSEPMTDYKAEQIERQYDQDNSQSRDSKVDELSDQVHHVFCRL